EASNQGVTIDLILRGICCLVPGVQGQSKNIRVRRLVDGFLEHARVFWFHNNGQDELYAGSSDWMKRNLYHRIEVIYPIYDTKLKQDLIKIIEWQLKDNVKATLLDQNNHNVAVPSKPSAPAIRAQTKIYEWLKNREEEQVLTD
ncbi:MAG: polyphosphate kinase 1, partial [Bacteroidetes bacterium]|nr:polyphosphate kinase 1 [Bacteroidota bacterium]